MTGIKIRFVAAIFFFISISSVTGHPHLFIDASIDFQFDSERLLGVQVYWVFDDFFTASILCDFDKNGDKKFSNAEIEDVRENAFQNLENYDYFTFIESANGSEPAKEALNFKTSLNEDGRLLYAFFVPFSLPLQQDEQTLTISMYDVTYFADIYFPENGYADVIDKGNLTYSLESGINKKRTYSAYEANPYEIIIRFKRE